MSEFWVSKKKYFCKYCEIYIADDAPSKTQHENGLRHKGNKDRFIRDLYKQGEKRKKDKAEEDREMLRVNQAAQAAYAKDVGLASAAGELASTSAPKPVQKQPPKSTDVWANYTTASSLGITDPENERLAAEADIRQKQGIAGAWSTVAVAPLAPSTSFAGQAVAGPSVVKRPREASPEDPEDARKFKVRQRTATVGLGNDLYDPGEIRVKRKGEDGTGVAASEERGVKEEAGDEDLPHWTPVNWKRPGEPEVKREEDGRGQGDEPNVKPEPSDSPDSTAPRPPPLESIQPSTVGEGQEETKPSITPPADDAEPSGGGLFKKRKAKSATAGKRKPLR